MDRTNSKKKVAMVLPGLAIAGLVAAFFLLLGLPEGRATPYLVFTSVTAFSVLLGIIWIVEKRGRPADSGVFVVIGSTLVLLTILFNAALTLAYRIYFHHLRADSQLFAVLLLGNGCSLLLLVGLPGYARFAGGLSRTDRNAKAHTAEVLRQLEAVERQFLAVSGRLGMHYSPSRHSPVAVLCESSRFLSPAVDACPEVLQIQSQIQTEINGLTATIDRGAATNAVEAESWFQEIENVCATLRELFRKREDLLTAPTAKMASQLR